MAFVLAVRTAAEVQGFYVDPDYAGSPRDGSAGRPWQSLADVQVPTPWDAVNGALANGDVTVWFSARASGSDVDETSTVGIELNRTNTSDTRLTLDGMSRYNTNDSAPSWAAYAGSSRLAVTVPIYALSTNNGGAPYTHRDNITVKGFKLVAVDQPVVVQNAGGFVFEENDVSAAAGAAVGPGLIYQHLPVGDTAHANFSREIIIRNNNIHDTFGEAIYISGNGGNGGAPPGDGTNTQTEDDVLIEGNTITNPGFYGGQGDGIDIKEGHTNLRIRANVINLISSPSVSNRGITAESADLIENNFVFNATTNAIVTTSGYGNTWGRDRLVLRNNIAIAGANNALKLDASDAPDAASEWYNTVIENNTFFKPSTTAADHVVTLNGHHNVTWRNNIVLGGTTAFQALWFTDTDFAVHDYNCYFIRSSDASWVVNSGVITYDRADITAWEANSLAAEPEFTAEGAPYLAENFKPGAGSPVEDAGTAISPAFTDFDGVARPPWDMGAFVI